MTTARDADSGEPHPNRRFRLDEVVQSRPLRPLWARPPISGRRLVIGLVVGVLVLWGGLYLVFRDWRARYRRRAAFGANRVAPAIDPMTAIVPRGVAPDTWRRAVADTHALLVDLTASNLLDLNQMEALRVEVGARVARARPETALKELSALWDDLEARSVPSLRERHPRPKLLQSRAAGQ